MDMKLPTLPKSTAPASMPEADRLLPIAIGAGLLAAGALLWRAKPRALDFPEPAPLKDSSSASLYQRAVRKSRDSVKVIAPDNLGVSLGRSMVIAGAALVVTRLLDELSDSLD